MLRRSASLKFPLPRPGWPGESEAHPCRPLKERYRLLPLICSGIKRRPGGEFPGWTLRDSATYIEKCASDSSPRPDEPEGRRFSCGRTIRFENRELYLILSRRKTAERARALKASPRSASDDFADYFETVLFTSILYIERYSYTLIFSPESL